MAQRTSWAVEAAAPPATGHPTAHTAVYRAPMLDLAPVPHMKNVPEDAATTHTPARSESSRGATRSHSRRLLHRWVMEGQTGKVGSGANGSTYGLLGLLVPFLELFGVEFVVWG